MSVPEHTYRRTESHKVTLTNKVYGA